MNGICTTSVHELKDVVSQYKRDPMRAAQMLIRDRGLLSLLTLFTANVLR